MWGFGVMSMNVKPSFKLAMGKLFNFSEPQF